MTARRHHAGRCAHHLARTRLPNQAQVACERHDGLKRRCVSGRLPGRSCGNSDRARRLRRKLAMDDRASVGEHWGWLRPLSRRSGRGAYDLPDPFPTGAANLRLRGPRPASTVRSERSASASSASLHCAPGRPRPDPRQPNVVVAIGEIPALRNALVGMLFERADERPELVPPRSRPSPNGSRCLASIAPQRTDTNVLAGSTSS
jgi:hypothetical protein